MTMVSAIKALGSKHLRYVYFGQLYDFSNLFCKLSTVGGW